MKAANIVKLALTNLIILIIFDKLLKTDNLSQIKNTVIQTVLQTVFQDKMTSNKICNTFFLVMHPLVVSVACNLRFSSVLQKQQAESKNAQEQHSGLQHFVAAPCYICISPLFYIKLQRYKPTSKSRFSLRLSKSLILLFIYGQP